MSIMSATGLCQHHGIHLSPLNYLSAEAMLNSVEAENYGTVITANNDYRIVHQAYYVSQPGLEIVEHPKREKSSDLIMQYLAAVNIAF